MMVYTQLLAVQMKYYVADFHLNMANSRTKRGQIVEGHRVPKEEQMKTRVKPDKH